MTTLTTCSNPAEAMLLKSMLEANGIPAFIPDELSAQTAPNFAGGIMHLQVADEHLEAAKQILSEAEAASHEDEADGDEAETADGPR